MTPADALASNRRMMVRAGEDIAVRRYAGTGAARAVTQEAIARGRVIGGGATELVGQVVQSYRKVILLNDPDANVPAGKVALSALLPLRTADKLFFRDLEAAILDIDDDTRRIQGVLIALDIRAGG
jgi:hypothetical protein